MKRLPITVLFPILVSLSGQSAFAQNAHDLFQKALVAERTQGDLDQAIQLYQQILANHADDRTLAAKALLQMGQCYEKLGNTEARKAYGRIVEEYADQTTISAQARTRLAALVSSVGRHRPSRPTFTRIRVPTDIEENMKLSPDGKHISLASKKKLWIMPAAGQLGPDIPGEPVALDTAGCLWVGLLTPGLRMVSGSRSMKKRPLTTTKKKPFWISASMSFFQRAVHLGRYMKRIATSARSTIESACPLTVRP